ncbi:MAG: putative Ig domain-containing protein [Gemmatimonadota bacterium]|nr:putative Ig domain-containing protein [Gemmatimonadota bacterium]MDE2983476.1 putative Ig domain-containing protein [Gemmatimonadota bacterium]
MDRAACSGLLLLAAGLAACETPPVPTAVEIGPEVGTADAIGATVQFSARVLDDRGAVIPGAEVEWWVRGMDVATISASGLATIVGPGRVTVGASHGPVTGHAVLVVRLRPAGVKIVSGDGQTGTALRALADRPTLFVHDAGGTPIADIEVAFDASDDGFAMPPKTTTNDDGEVSTTWVLGLPTGTQTLRAHVHSLAIEFTATATDPPLSIPSFVLSRGRLTVPYRQAIEAQGGTPPLFWSLASGSMPAGLFLDSAGVIAGTPTEIDRTTFRVRVRDAAGNEASRAMEFRVCEGPLRMDPGETVVDNPVGISPCPPFLPAGEEGDRYRVAVVRTEVVDDPTRISVVVKVDRADSEASRGLLTAPALPARPAPRLFPGLSAGLRIADESSRMHARLVADAERIIRELGTGAVLPDRRPEVSRSGPGGPMGRDPPPDRRVFRPYLDYRESCEDPPPALKPAYLVAYSDHLAIYQDSVQQGLDPIRGADARQVLDYYEDYGAETIEEYFGTVPDINGDGRVNVFVSPVVPPWVAGFVWAGDFLSSEECSWSNEMELVYYNEHLFDLLEQAPDSGHYQALPTMVHEVKHLNSLYIRTRLGAYQPSWIEEGTAEIAAEISSRRAMEAAGGIARGARLDRDAYPARPGTIITPENYGVLLRLARMTMSYSGVLNSISVNPTEEHTYYGTSWHFHRFLGDAHGNAAARGDGSFFTALNDSTTPRGTAGIVVVTGRSMSELLVQYTAAMMLNGTEAPEPEHGFTTYDLPSATFELLRPEFQPEGLYPWLHTGPEPVGFDDAFYSGTLAPGGIRFHEFESDGTGTGIEVEVSTSDAIGAVRVVIVRMR